MALLNDCLGAWNCAVWQHKYSDVAFPIGSQFASAPTIGRNRALVSAGVAVQWNERFDVRLLSRTTGPR